MAKYQRGTTHVFFVKPVRVCGCSPRFGSSIRVLSDSRTLVEHATTTKAPPPLRMAGGLTTTTGLSLALSPSRGGTCETQLMEPCLMAGRSFWESGDRFEMGCGSP